MGIAMAAPSYSDRRAGLLPDHRAPVETGSSSVETYVYISASPAQKERLSKLKNSHTREPPAFSLYSHTVDAFHSGPKTSTSPDPT